jgi:hypothetical protein
MSRLAALLPLIVACHDPDASFGDGVSVGNPTKGVTARVVPGGDVKNLHGRIGVSTLALLACDDGPATVVAEDVELPPGGRRIALPAGDYCGLEAAFDDLLRMSGSLDGGGRFELALDVGAVEVDADAAFDTTADELLLVLGPPAWLGAAGLDAGPGDLVEVGPGDPAHDALASAVRERSLLYEDVDVDHLPGDDERIVARGRGEAARGRAPAGG